MSEKYLGIDASELEMKGGLNTAREIARQPLVWKRTYDLVYKQKEKIKNFFKFVTEQENCDIIITGAGTSAFIGNSLHGPFQNLVSRNTRSIPTTDLVTHPDLYIRPEIPTLLISMARSGDSPESCAAVKIVNSKSRKIHNLIITCNPAGKLAKKCTTENDMVFLLPPESNDLGLAMTSSFSSMLLAGILMANIHTIDDQERCVNKLSNYGYVILNEYAEKLLKVARLSFDRAVFLGSGPFQGIAQESQLKLQELTAGKIICKHDSFLGFRHGPKAVINGNTLLVYLLTNNSYVHKYEVDLVKEVACIHKEMYSIGIFENTEEELKFDLKIKVSSDPEIRLPEEYLAVSSVLPAQILGFYKSLEFGLKPDSPSIDDVISRVVKGVSIYPIEY